MSPCRSCQSVIQTKTWKIPETMFRLGHDYEYSECADCGSLTLQAGDVSRFLYPENYYSLTTSPVDVFSSRAKYIVASLLAQATRARFSALLRLCRAIAPIKELRTLSTMLLAVSYSIPKNSDISILDVGSGSGILPYVLGSAKIQTDGIDPFTRTQWRNEYSSNTRKNLEEVNGKFDLIMFHHSLEHVMNPLGDLRSAKAMLKKEGRILVRIPFLDSSAWTVYREHWYQIDAPRHTFIPSKKGIDALILDAELSIVETYCDSSSAQFWLSSAIRAGLSQMDPEVNSSAFRRDTSTLGQRLTNWFRTYTLNRRLRGDQLVILLAPR